MPEKVIEHVGIAPDSAEHIALLESKLKKLQKNNPSKISGKDIITSMCQFRDIYMQDYMANGSNTNDSGAIIVESIDTSYLERKFLPEQPIAAEETVKLVEHDILSDTKKESEDLTEN